MPREKRNIREPLHKRLAYLDYGPGRKNKYMEYDQTKSTVCYREQHEGYFRDGRPLWQNMQNPYQYDIPFINRQNLASEYASQMAQRSIDDYMQQVRRCESEPSLSYRHMPFDRNPVFTIPKTMSGYKGYIQGYYAENIMGKNFPNTTEEAQAVRRFPELLSTAPRINGTYIRPPVPFNTKITCETYSTST